MRLPEQCNHEHVVEDSHNGEKYCHDCGLIFSKPPEPESEDIFY